MKHTIPLHFIAAFLTLCLCILCMCPPLSAKSSLSSAMAIPIGAEKRITIAAYDTQYLYFQIPASFQSNNQKISITLSADDARLQLSALDCYGTPLPLKKSGSTYELSGKQLYTERCFLCLQNPRKTEQTVTLSICCIPLETATPKTSPARRKSKPRKTTTPSGNTAKKKFPTKKTERSSKKKKSSHKSYISQSNHKPMYQNRTPVPTSNQPLITHKPAKKKLYKDNGSPTVSPAIILPPPKTHFVRLQQGSSLFLAKRLFNQIPKEHITILPSSSSVSVNNGIIYVPKDGLYYLSLEYGTKRTSCTILVTPK